jgi:hypothetical protein
VASVAGPRPVCGVHPSGSVVQGSGGPAVRCPARPVSGHLVSSSRGPAVRTDGVHPSSVQPSSVQPSGVQPSGVHPVRPDASVPSHPRRWRWDQGRCGGHPAPRERVEVAVGGRAVEQPGRRPREAWTRTTLPRPRVGQRGRRRPGRAVLGRRRLTADRPGRPGRRAGRPWLAAALWAREQAPARGCCTGRVAAVLGWAGDHGGWWSWRLTRGWMGPEGQWACRRGWACGPSAAQAGSGRDRPAGSSALTCDDGWWACQDLNLGPHPDPRINGEQARSSIRAEPGCNQVDLG